MKFLTDDNLKKFWEWYLLPETLKNHKLSYLLDYTNSSPIKVRFLSYSINEQLGVLLNYYRDVHHLILVPDYDVNLKKYFHWIIEGGETKRGQTLDKFERYDDSVESMLLKANEITNLERKHLDNCIGSIGEGVNSKSYEFLEEVGVVMTLSEKPKVNGQNIYRKGKGNLKLPITGAEARRLVNSGYSPFNLHLVSDKPIKSHDNTYFTICGEPHLGISGDGFMDDDTTKKIIATIDDSLVVDTPLHERKYIPCNNQLPQVPHSFLEVFVFSQGKINKVFVEHENPFPEAMGNVVLPTVLKTTDENEVIIHLIK